MTEASIALFVYSNSFCQINLAGAYSWTEPAGLGGTRVILSKENTFASYSSGDLAGMHVSKGYYLLRIDTLIMIYEALKDPNPSYYEIVKKTDTIKPQIGQTTKVNPNHTNISLKIIDDKGLPLKACDIFLRKGKDMLSLYTSNPNGTANIFTTGQIADSVHIGFIGYKTLSIGLKEFMGYFSDLKVVLSTSNNTYNDRIFIEKYLLQKKDKKVISLKSLNSEGSSLIRENPAKEK